MAAHQALLAMLKIFQARLQQYVSQELPDVQAGFRKGRGTRDQIANVHWIVKKASEVQKKICFIDYAKAFDCVGHNKLWKILRDGNTRPLDLHPEKICMQVKKLKPSKEQQTGSKWGKGYVKAVSCHPA